MSLWYLITANLELGVMDSKSDEVIDDFLPQVQTINRRLLLNSPDGPMIVCLSRPEGTFFLTENNAWGLVRIARNPVYFALYISKPYSEVKYYAEVEKVVRPTDAGSRVPDSIGYKKPSEDMKLILLKRESLKQISNPIPRGTLKPRNSFYTTLQKFIAARTVNQL